MSEPAVKPCRYVIRFTCRRCRKETELPWAEITGADTEEITRKQRQLDFAFFTRKHDLLTEKAALLPDLRCAHCGKIQHRVRPRLMPKRLWERLTWRDEILFDHAHLSVEALLNLTLGLRGDQRALCIEQLRLRDADFVERYIAEREAYWEEHPIISPFSGCPSCLSQNVTVQHCGGEVLYESESEYIVEEEYDEVSCPDCGWTGREVCTCDPRTEEHSRFLEFARDYRTAASAPV